MSVLPVVTAQMYACQAFSLGSVKAWHRRATLRVALSLTRCTRSYVSLLSVGDPGLEWVVEMQLATDILKLLFFPGLLFVAFCGCLVLFLEGRLRTALYGGEGFHLRTFAGGGTADISSAGELLAVALSLAALGMAGVMLVGARGDLFTILLLFTAAEMLPLFMAGARGGEEALCVPLLFRTALYRMMALAAIAIAISLRFPASFSPGLETFRGEGAFGAVQLWQGLDFALVLASLVCAALAFLVYLLGYTAYRGCYKGGEVDAGASFHVFAVEGSQRAASLLLFVLLFLGYPWEGGTALLSWSAAVVGVVALLTVIRAWLDGRDRVLLRKLQGSAPIFALLSLALAFAVVV